jgi:hypothetical protein
LSVARPAAIGKGGRALRMASARHLAALGREPNVGDDNAVTQTQIWPRRAVGNCGQQTLCREARESFSKGALEQRAELELEVGGAGSFIYQC